MREDAFRKTCSEQRIATDGDVEHFELGSNADALGMGSASKWTVLLGSGFRLQRKDVSSDLVDAGRLPGQVPLGFAAGHTETSCQEEHSILR